MFSRRTVALGMAALLAGCGSDTASQAGQDGDSPAVASAPSGEEDHGLTQKELEQGIGPIYDLELAPLDAALAETGESYFTTKCSACHKLDERYVGPELGSILDKRTPEFVMNMILNSAEMVQRHPEVKAMLAEFFTPMPTQVTDHDEARAILEYLRSAQAGSN